MRTLKSIQKEIAALGEIDLFGTAKEVSHLPEILDDDEHIKYLTSGLMNGTTWLIVCTQKRIILVDYGILFGVTQTEMALENINSITYQIGLLLGSIEIWHGGAKMLIENCKKQTVKPFCAAVNAARKALKNGASDPANVPQKSTHDSRTTSTDDVMSQLERLAALKEKGILTNEEFATQKAKILGTYSKEPKEEAKTEQRTKADAAESAYEKPASLNEDADSAHEKPSSVNEEQPSAHKATAPAHEKTATVNEKPVSTHKKLESQAKEDAPVPKVYKNPKEEFETLFYAAIQKASNNDFSERFLLADKNPKKILTAVKTYAKNCVGEEILVAYDDSTFVNGKVGFLLSNKKLYIGNSFEKPQELALSDVRLITATPKFVNSFITVNDIKIDTAMINGASTEILANFLQKALPIAMQIEVQP